MTSETTPNSSVNNAPLSTGLAQDEYVVSLTDIFKVLFKYKVMIVVVSILGALSGYAASYLVKKKYKTYATFISISSKKTPTIGGQLGNLASLIGMGAAQNQDGGENLNVLLGSRTFAGKVVKELDLLPTIYERIYDKEKQEFIKTPPRAEDAGGALLSAIKVEPGPGGSKKLVVEWHDPEYAQKIANSYIGVIEDYLSNNTLTASQKNLEFIQEQLKKAEKEMHETSQRLMSFAEEHNLIKVSDQLKLVTQTLNQLKQKKLLAEVERSVLSQFQSQDSLEIRKLNLRIKALNTQIEKLVGEKVESQGVLPGMGVNTPVRALQPLLFQEELLSRELKVQAEVYKTLKAQLEQKKIQVANETKRFKIIDPALKPTAHFKPRRKVFFILGGILSFMAAIGLSLFIEFVIPRLRSSIA